VTICVGIGADYVYTFGNGYSAGLFLEEVRGETTHDFLGEVRIYLNLPVKRTVAGVSLTGRRCP